MTSIKRSSSGQVVKKGENTETIVVCLKRKRDGVIIQDCDVYIGRKLTMGGWNLKESEYCNKYFIKKYIEKYGKEEGEKRCLEDYEKDLRSNKELMKKIIKLDGKILGCWCKKKGYEKCHGDIIIKIINEIKSNTEPV